MAVYDITKKQSVEENQLKNGYVYLLEDGEIYLYSSKHEEFIHLQDAVVIDKQDMEWNVIKELGKIHKIITIDG